jgi:fatty acid desaturase
MNSTSVDPVLVVVLALAGLGVLAAFRSGARGAYRVARHSQEVTRMGGNLGRALGTTVVIVAIQWAVMSLTTDPRAWGLALGVPALFAGAAIARMFSVTEIVHSAGHRGVRR